MQKTGFPFFFLFNSPVLSSSHIFLFFLLFPLAFRPSTGVYLRVSLTEGPMFDQLF